MVNLFGIKTGIVGVMLLVGLVCLAIISRNWSCRQQRPPRPPHSWTFTVSAVPNGASFVVKAGLRARRTITVTLADIAAPPAGDKHADASRANLEHLAGTRIRVETPRSGLFHATSDATDGETELMDATRGDLVGVVYGESGACLNLAQVSDGYATCLPSAPKEWKKQEAAARKAKLGLWSKEK